MKLKLILKLSQNLHKKWEEIPKEQWMLLESTMKKLDTLIFITAHQWKPTLNKLPGNANQINNVNATVPYGLDLLKDSMIRSQLLNSTISDSLKHYLRTLLRMLGLHATQPLSVLTHIQERQPPASAKINHCILQTFVPMTVKTAYALVTWHTVRNSAPPRSHLTSRAIWKLEDSPLPRSKREPRVLPALLIHSVGLTHPERIRMH